MKSEKHFFTAAAVDVRSIRGTKTFLFDDPVNFAKTMKLRFRVGDLGLPERRKRCEYISSREEEKVGAQMCRCGKAIESRTHVVGECEMYKEERNVSEKRR